MSAAILPHPHTVESAVYYARCGREAIGGCVKSNRGAVVFDPERNDHRRRPLLVGVGWNGPPARFKCTGSDACRKACGTICMHAEQRAIMHAFTSHAIMPRMELLHAKIGDDGKLVAGGPPSCVQCSRLIVEVGWIIGVWLYEEPREAHDESLDNFGRWLSGEPQIVPSGSPAWVRYDPVKFHRLSMLNSNLTP